MMRELKHRKDQIMNMLENLRIDIPELAEVENYIIQSDNKHRRTEAMLKTMMENTPDIIATIAQDGTVFSINININNIVEHNEELGNNIYNYIAPEYRVSFKDSLDRVFRTGKSDILEILALGAYGQNSAWYEVRIIPIQDNDHVKSAMLINTDITENKQTPLALLASEERYRSVVESSDDSVFLVDKNTRFLFANKKYLSRLGMSLGDILGHEYGDFHSSEATDEFVKMINLVFKKEKSVIYEHQSQRDLNYFLRTLSPVIDPNSNEIKAITVISKDISETKEVQLELKNSYHKLQRIFEETVNAFSAITESRDPYTAGHQQRMARLACAIAKEMGLSDDQIEGIRVAGILHDIGKISIPVEILTKPGTLNSLEKNFINTHSQVGYDILNMIEFPWPVAQAVLQHHERLDGSGYPQGLSNENIILEAKILAVADVVEAMIFHRPYREAHGLEKAIDEITEQKGILYDSEVVDSCVKIFNEGRFIF